MLAETAVEISTKEQCPACQGQGSTGCGFDPCLVCDETGEVDCACCSVCGGELVEGFKVRHDMLWCKRCLDQEAEERQQIADEEAMLSCEDDYAYRMED